MKKLLIYLIICLLTEVVQGQGIYSRFKNYGIYDGLSQTSVNQVYQDKKGFMWFATSDGLNKFDGYKFTVYKFDYKNPNSLSDSWVAGIFGEDSDNELWMITTDLIIHKLNLRTNEFKRFIPNSKDSSGLLPFNRVYFLFEDYQKNIWISTSSGLCRYDKIKQKFFYYCLITNNPKEIVYNMYEDSKGYLWVLSQKGLCRYNHKTDKFIHYNSKPEDPQSLSSNLITRVAEDSEKNFWILTPNGLNKFNPQKDNFTRYPFDKSYDFSDTKYAPYILKPDSKGQLWIGSRLGLSMFDVKQAKYYSFESNDRNPSSLSSNFITGILVDKDNNLWVGTSNGLNKYISSSGKFERYYAKSPVLKENYIADIFQDRIGEVWVLSFMQPSKTGYLSKVNLLTKEIEDISDSKFNSETIGDYILGQPFKDRSGNFWFGSFDNGVYKYTPANKNFDHYRQIYGDPTSLGGASVWGFAEDNDKNIWIALYNQGFDKFDPGTGKFTHFKPPQITRNGLTLPVNSVTKDKNSDLLVAVSGGGLLRMNPKTGKIHQYSNIPDDPNSIGSNYVRKAIVDKNGNLWVALFNGLDFFDSKTGKFFHFVHDTANINSISNNIIWSIFLDSKEELWISCAQEGYIDRYNTRTKRFTHYKSKSKESSGLLSNKALCILEDKNGNIWFGTGGGGLSMFNRGTDKFTHWTEADGLPNNTIYGIVEDQEGCLWLSTNRGLSKFDPKGNSFTNFDVSHGLQSNEFNMGAYFKGHNNKIYFGGINGFNILNPQKMVKDSILSETVITGFQILNKEVKVVPPDKRNSISATHPDRLVSLDHTLYLPQSITYAKKIELTYKEKVLTFEFSAIDFRDPDRTKYRYKMEGFDRDWNYSENRRFVTYTNLPSGEYVFKVASTNPDGIWNPTPTELTIVITPPFWLTWWFILIEVLFLTGCIIMIVRIRERSLKHAKLHLEEKIKARTHEIEEKNEELKLRNIQILKQKEEIATQAKQLKVELVSQNQASELALLRTQINPHFLFNTLNNIYSLVYQKADSASEAVMKLSEIMRYMLYDASAEKVLLEKEINYLKSFIELQVLRLKNKDFVQFTIEGNYSGLVVSPMLLISFVENAFKHGSKRGDNPGIIINLNVTGRKITFEVTNYIGKNENVTKDQTGGIGLLNVKRRLDLLYMGKYTLDINQNCETYQVKLELEEL